MNEKKLKVFVGVSGGVDSSVAVYLLQKQGYEVHGVFIKTWQPDWVPCTWVDEKRDAMRVCAHLNIPFHFLDAEAEYKQGVADYMISEYAAGRTPNPDVLCNRIIKFGSFMRYALEQGADFIATGHYAQVKHEVNEHTLCVAADEAKDQSYFLWMLTQEDLKHTLFPIGHLQKSEVRRIAEEAGLFTAEKKDSQGICFLGAIDMKDFLRHYITPVQGNVLDETGKVIGTHDGVWFFTLGERHGFTITKPISGKPYYIVAKNIQENTITVSHNSPEEKNISLLVATLLQTNWINQAVKDKHYTAQVRYHSKKVPCTISNNEITFLENPGAFTPAQSVVVFDGDECIGGGIVN